MDDHRRYSLSEEIILLCVEIIFEISKHPRLTENGSASRLAKPFRFNTSHSQVKKAQISFASLLPLGTGDPEYQACPKGNWTDVS